MFNLIQINFLLITIKSLFFNHNYFKLQLMSIYKTSSLLFIKTINKEKLFFIYNSCLFLIYHKKDISSNSPQDTSNDILEDVSNNKLLPKKKRAK